MPSQQGYFDTLKSVAAKVFTYLASITLTGTDGKTITVTQDTSLDEAVAMSSKAPKTDTIKGDGTAGRVLRIVSMSIYDGTAAATIKVRTDSVWNGDTNAPEDNLGKPATGTAFNLSADGHSILWKNAAISGDAVTVVTASLTDNRTGDSIQVSAYKDASGINVRLLDPVAGGTVYDMTAKLTAGEFVSISIVYLTSA